jgi:hypothetical protein
MVGGMMKSAFGGASKGITNPLTGGAKAGAGMMPSPKITPSPTTPSQGINTGPSSGVSGAMMGALPGTLSALSNSMGGGGGQARGAGGNPFSQLWANQPFQNANAGGFMYPPQQQQDPSSLFDTYMRNKNPLASPQGGGGVTISGNMPEGPAMNLGGGSMQGIKPPTFGTMGGFGTGLGSANRRFGAF